MKKTGLFSIVFLLMVGLLSNGSLAEDYTQWHLPEGATARLGKGSINDIEFSPDDNRLAVATDIGIWMYDAHTGAEISFIKVQPRGHKTVSAIAFAPDGKTLAVGNWVFDGAVELWDINTEERTTILKEKVGSVKGLAFSADGTMLACASWHRNVEYHLWEVATGREVIHFIGEQDVLHNGLALSPDAHSVASAGRETVFLWDVPTEGLRHVIEGDESLAWTLAFSPDSKTLAGGQTTIRLWDAETADELSKLEGHTRNVDAITFSPDGKILASGDTGGKIMLSHFDPRSQKPDPQKPTLPRLLRSFTGEKTPRHENRTLTGHTLPVRTLDFTADGKILASGSHDGTAKVWDVATGDSILTLHGHTISVKALQFFENGEMLYCSSSDGILRMWDVDANTEARVHTRPPWFAFAADLSSDGKMIASTCWSEVRLWDTNTQNFLEPLTGHQRFVLTVAFSPDDKRLVSGSREGRVILWDVPNHQRLSTYDVHTDEVDVVVFSPDGKKFASASKDGTVQLWDLHTEKRTTLFTEPNDGVRVVAFSPDSRTLVSGRRDGTMQLWDVETHQHIANFIDAKGTIYGLVFSPDGKTVVTGLRGGLIRLWDLETRTLHQEIRTGDAAAPTQFAFTPDGKTLVSGAYDGTVLVWDLESVVHRDR